VTLIVTAGRAGLLGSSPEMMSLNSLAGHRTAISDRAGIARLDAQTPRRGGVAP